MGEINSTFIALIPKDDGEAAFSDFRPLMLMTLLHYIRFLLVAPVLCYMLLHLQDHNKGDGE